MLMPASNKGPIPIKENYIQIFPLNINGKYLSKIVNSGTHEGDNTLGNPFLEL